MASKTKTGLLPIVLLAAVVLVAVPEARNEVLGLIDGAAGGTELVGEGETQFLVAASAASEVHKCAPAQGLADQQCDDLKFVILDAAKMPFIARNISTAWQAGHPGVLTKDRTAEAVNRRKVCLPSFPRKHGGQCDEFPFASTRQGGAGAQEQEVPARENQCQGGTLSRRYVAAGIGDGDDFLVVITHPDKIAQGPFQGVDIAEDQSWCG
ncbi:NucA/NucB deoxyribonuclease domain-containing protein [Saccharothrix deserti]|uniref:NucA/NucB deoxyribonuclease domain-containing protein n=1 Tax=Saccharothrix deserti TaxID=2593674 RepID=UPI00131A8C78|nr:NucA/NucB deoxyribonuclease domain-containing protein [Saccharothrix deserti]